MDIQESLRCILEQKQAVTHRFFTVALSGQEAYFLLVASERETPPTSIAPRMIYKQFTQDLLQTLQEFHGPEWNAELREQWKVAIERVGRIILGG